MIILLQYGEEGHPSSWSSSIRMTSENANGRHRTRTAHRHSVLSWTPIRISRSENGHTTKETKWCNLPSLTCRNSFVNFRENACFSDGIPAKETKVVVISDYDLPELRNAVTSEAFWQPSIWIIHTSFSKFLPGCTETIGNSDHPIMCKHLSVSSDLVTKRRG